MKFLTSAIVLALSLAACNSDPKTDLGTKKEIVADTTTNYNNSVLTDTGTAIQPELSTVAPALTEAKKNKNTTPKSQKPVTTKIAAITANPAPVTAENTTVNTTATQPAISNEPAPVATEGKKGWSNAAKGAVIGGGAGAIGGAIISKKKGKGAIIGGVLGAAGGYIIGRNKDKKDTAR